MGSAYSIIGYIQWIKVGKRDYGKAGYDRAAATFDPNDMKVDMKGKIVILTGANKGIGRECANELAVLGATLHLLCRDAGRGEEAKKEIIQASGNQNIHLHVVDCACLGQIRSFAEEFRKTNDKVHVFIHNAGVMPLTKTMTSEGKETSMATMLAGTFLLTGLLVPFLKKGAPSRVINVSSGGMYNVKARPNDLNAEHFAYDKTLVYALNKRTQVILTEMWAEKLKGTGIVVNSMHPGWADTDGLKIQMSDFHEEHARTLRNAKEGADTITWLAVCERVKDQTGLFWFDRQAVSTNFPWAGTDSSAKERQLLWKKAAEFCNYDFKGE